MKAPLYLAILLLSACSALGVPSPQSFKQKLGAAYEADTAVLTSTQALLSADKITAADAKNVEAQADNVKAGLDIARSTYATDQTAGSTKLQSVITALSGLQTYLGSKK